MFEPMPLRVPESLARAIATAPATWIDILRTSGASRDAVETGGFRFGFLTDVRLKVFALTLYGGAEALNNYEKRADELLDAVRRAFRDEPTKDPEVVDVWACVAAEVLNWNLFVALTKRVQPDDEDLYARMGRVLAEPAARFCRDLASAARAAA